MFLLRNRLTRVLAIMFPCLVALSGCERYVRPTAKTTPVTVWLSVDSNGNGVAYPTLVPLSVMKHEYVLWRLAPGQAFDFEIDMKDENLPQEARLPKPVCTPNRRECQSIVPAVRHYGRHDYVITVLTSAGAKKIDPQIEIDP